MTISRERFEQLVQKALRVIPPRFRKAVRNVAVLIEDEPSADLLAEMGVEPPDTLYGLYRGTPLPDRSWSEGARMPDSVTLFYRPIAEDSPTESEAFITIAETVIHEFGHYFGLSEEEIEAIEDEFWSDDESP